MSKSKVPYKDKAEIVRDYLEGRVGYTESLKRANNSKESFCRWVHLYQEKGAAGLLPNSRNKVYPEDVKRTAVQEYLSGHGSLGSICEKYEIRSTRQLRKWIKVYNAHGDFNSRKDSGGGSCMKQGRDTTQEERVQIVKDCLASGKNYGEMALKYKVSYQQVRIWTLRFEEMGEAGLEDRRGKRKKDQVPRTELEKAQIEIEQLKHRLYLAEMERDLLKKLDEIERRDAFQKRDSAASMPRSGKHTGKRGIRSDRPASCSTQRARLTTNGLPAS